MILRRWWHQRTLHNLVGLDIDSDVIKLLKINSLESPAKVETFAVESLPAGTFVKDEIKDPAIIVTTLKNMYRQCGLSKDKDFVALAIPRAAAIIKKVTIDKRLNEAEIESRAWVEANRNFPELVGEIHLDFAVLDSTANDPTQVELILVACRKEQIKPYLEILRQSNLTPKILDVNSYALERALAAILPQQKKSEAAALLNLNFTLSTLIVNYENQVIYAHDHSYDGHRLITQVRKYLQDEEKNIATPFAHRESLMSDTAYIDILKENLSAHLRHTIHFFYSSRPNINVHKLILAGDCATVPSLAEFIQQEINIETTLANPFTNMTIAANVDKNSLTKYAPTLALCSGLALSQIMY